MSAEDVLRQTVRFYREYAPANSREADAIDAVLAELARLRDECDAAYKRETTAVGDAEHRVELAETELASLRERLEASRGVGRSAEQECASLRGQLAKVGWNGHSAKEWSLALQSLTPQGSEFASDPQECVKFVRKQYDDELRLRKELASLRERDEQLSEMRRLLMEYGWDSTGNPVDALRLRVSSLRERLALWESLPPAMRGHGIEVGDFPVSVGAAIALLIERLAEAERARDKAQGFRAGHPAMCCGKCCDSIAQAEARERVLREALEFYADSRRYQGANQTCREGDDRFTPKGFPFLIDASRDHGEIARAALSQSKAAPEVKP